MSGVTRDGAAEPVSRSFSGANGDRGDYFFLFSRIGNLTHTLQQVMTSFICEWHRMIRMTGPDCAVMCNSINIHTYMNTYTLSDEVREIV